MKAPRRLPLAANLPARLALILALASASPLWASPEFDAAKALFDQQKFPEARAAFTSLASAEPKNAAVCYYLGTAFAHAGDEKSAEAAALWLGKAVELDPTNASYAEKHGLALLSVASRSRNPFTATKGRDALEKAVTLDPGLFSAHEALIEFYDAAPGPIGSSAKAKAHLAEIRQRDPGRGVEIELLQNRPEARAHLSDAAIAQAATPEARRQLRILRAASEPPPSPLVLAQVTGDRAYLSDAEWTSAKVGWGQPARNHYWFDATVKDAVFLKLDGKIYEKGLFAHASSRYVFALDGKWKTLTATVGLRDGAFAEGSAIFTVRGDGRELYRSPILRAGTGQPVEVDITGVKELELLAIGGEGHIRHAWSIWVDPLVRR